MKGTAPALTIVANLVSQRTGLSFAQRADQVEAGVRRAMARTAYSDVDDYAQVLANDDDALDDLVNELTVGETYFFREPAQFRLIQHTILPDVRARRGAEPALRAWSAACASGEEAYSLAILLRQAHLLERAHLIATDISHVALAKARRATYEPWSLRGEGAAQARPYLTQHGKQYQLHESIRQGVTFHPLNLARAVYPAQANGLWNMDLILCRNVLIYLDPLTVRKVAERLYETLAEGGWLLTASSDPPLWEHAPFAVVTTEEGVFYRRLAGQQLQGVTPEVLAPELAPLAGAELPSETIAESPPESALTSARQALQQGAYRAVVELTQTKLDDAEAAILHVRALANYDPAEAERACAQVLERHPLSVELHHLHSVLFLTLNRREEAIRVGRQVVYLDRSLAIAHFMLGTMLRDQGERSAASRAFRNARDLCAARPAEEELPLADGEQAGRLAESAGRELALLEAKETTA